MLACLIEEGIKVGDFIRERLQLCDIFRKNLGARLATGAWQRLKRRRQEGVSGLCCILVGAIKHFTQ